MMTNEADYILIGQAARVLKRPDHQVRRTADQLWPNAPRSGRFRMIPRAELCNLAAAIAERYPVRTSSPKANSRPDSC
jgi:hypothetical protein